MKLPFATTLCALAILTTSGCTLAKIYATSGNDVSLVQSNTKVGTPVTVQKRITFDYTNSLDVQELLRGQFGSGHEFQNVSVKLQVEPADFFINLFTLGIAQSKTFEITRMSHIPWKLSKRRSSIKQYT